ncbi:OmpA family protein [Hymenobacter metallilatus]|uniref:OmpA family protein n=1 Tax=Hymenobacter metallilatus TaxID=2493666 RepID=A0A428IYL1_9BACT|nr:OmpA family protein [Hymenobacter metallilatus]RSK24039.1 OmpA family protein [Hymenobacter metallilatus]
MNTRIWYCIMALLLPAGPGHAQSLAGVWQGVETETGQRDGFWPTVLRIQPSKRNDYFGVLYQEVGGQARVSVTFQVQAARTATGLRLDHGRKLQESGRSLFSYWCDGSIAFTYDAAQEKLTGRATYRPVGDCDQGTFILYRVKLKSAATVTAGAETTIRVSGRNVLWYADAELKQPVATGNSYRTRLTKTTTFYLTQGYYSTAESAVTPVTVLVSETASPSRPGPVEPLAARPPARLNPQPEALVPAPAPALPAAPVVLPTVLFRLGTPELLADGLPALNRLAAELLARPTLQLLVAGHTDKIGEPQKNQVLSEQRAEAVKAYLVKAGVPARRIRTVGYGDARPLFPSPDARNRRVEVSEVPE